MIVSFSYESDNDSVYTVLKRLIDIAFDVTLTDGRVVSGILSEVGVTDDGVDEEAVYIWLTDELGGNGRWFMYANDISVMEYC